MPIVSAPRRGVSKGAACPSMPPSRRVVVIVLLSVGPKDCGEKVGPLGFEPRFADPKSAVLPLDEGPVRLRWWKLMRGEPRCSPRTPSLVVEFHRMTSSAALDTVACRRLISRMRNRLHLALPVLVLAVTAN